MIKTSETAITIEWWDEVTGSWGDLGEARSLAAASQRIAGLRAADATPQRYRITETTYYEEADIVLGPIPA